MVRIAALLLLAAVSLVPVLGSTAWAQSYGKAERRDPIFLRFSDMANRYWVNSETNSASHKVVAIPMPKQCAFLYADAYTRGQQSEREVQDIALSSCNRRLAELGPLGENYGVDCRCQVVISDENYVVPKSSMPDDAYGPTSIFYRDDRGNVARLNGLVRYGALIGRERVAIGSSCRWMRISLTMIPCSPTSRYCFSPTISWNLLARKQSFVSTAARYSTL